MRQLTMSTFPEAKQVHKHFEQSFVWQSTLWPGVIKKNPMEQKVGFEAKEYRISIT